MYLFAGLGNVGREYEYTRHNVGFLCVDEIRNTYNIGEHRVKFGADLFFGKIESKDVIVAKPKTFMNRSGIAISQIKSFYKIFLENIFVFHDDLDLEFCRIKYKLGGSSAGHNGIKNIDEMISKNYNRIRFGIGRPEDRRDVVDFVLQKFNTEELKCVSTLAKKISENVGTLLGNKSEEFTNKLTISTHTTTQ
ncbi:MAG: aminoacyl-tRNA hydrolase [Rickettsiales bacterium]|jgi:PTH1 family peptidyl-tRNA hydrolase|nr:aminoacyl-tRNA hydrolase [Rickettsiales bacterium]